MTTGTEPDPFIPVFKEIDARLHEALDRFRGTPSWTVEALANAVPTEGEK